MIKCLRIDPLGLFYFALLTEVIFLNFKFLDIVHIRWNFWMSVTVSISELILMFSVPQQIYIMYFDSLYSLLV